MDISNVMTEKLIIIWRTMRAAKLSVASG